MSLSPATRFGSEAIHDLAQQRRAFLLHLHADRNVFRRRVLPERIGLWIDGPCRLIGQGAAGEQADAGAAAAQPVIERLHRIGRHGVPSACRRARVSAGLFLTPKSPDGNGPALSRADAIWARCLGGLSERRLSSPNSE